MNSPSDQNESEYVVEIGALPGRKSKALSVRRGNVIWPVAYFRDDESYERFREAVDGKARIRWDPHDHRLASDEGER